MLLTDTIISGSIGVVISVVTWFLERKNQASAIKNSEDRLRICQHFGGVGLWEADLINREISSVSCPDHVGTQLIQNLSWHEFLDTVHVDDRKMLSNAIQTISQRNLSYQVEYRGLTGNQQIRWLRSVGEVDCDIFGKPLKIRGAFQDVTERKTLEARIRVSDQVLSLTFEGIIITDTQANVLDVNPAFCQITGYNREEILGQPVGIFNSDQYTSDFYDQIRKTLQETGQWQGELISRKKSGAAFKAFVAMYGLHDHLGKLINYVGLVSETSPNQSSTSPETHLHYDPHTQLLDRVLFSDRFAQALAHSKRFNTLTAICYLDLDGFALLNDNFGCQVGDQILIEVAKRIKFNLREGDSICRMGGDEFALLFENLQSLPQCIDTLNRIHHMLAEPLVFDGQQLRITASSGATVYPLDKEEPDVLLSHANEAMQQAKDAGRNCYRFYTNLQVSQFFPPSNSAISSSSSIERRLIEIENALQLQQFCLYYQPKVNIKTGETLGAEALLRWRHPEQGLLPPSEFLPLIAKTDLEVKLGVWVIKQVFQQLTIWQELGLMLQISVNVSAHFLLSDGFVPMLQGVLKEFPAILARQLELELLEGHSLEDLIAVSDILKVCYSQLGVSCAMDGFGAGYATLPHMQSVPNTVKIEQSFVRNMIDNADDQAIIEGVIARCKSLKQTSVAEGVETLEHGIYLIALGCSIAQGFGIAQPMPANALVDWIINYQNPAAWVERGKIQLSVWQTELELLKIQQKHWFYRLQSWLEAPVEGELQWSLLDRENSHLGKWLARIKNQQFFDRRLFDRLQEFHSQQHMLAQQLVNKRQAGVGEIEELGCKQLININEEIEELLQQFELFG